MSEEQKRYWPGFIQKADSVKRMKPPLQDIMLCEKAVAAKFATAHFGFHRAAEQGLS